MTKPHVRFLALTLIVAACSRPATKDEAVGAYAMNKGKAHDTLIVYPNGQYVRRYAASAGAPLVVDSGQWTWETVKTEESLTLENFTQRWNDELFPPTKATPGSWRAQPERKFNGIVSIPAEKDLGWAYVRVQH